VDAAEGRKNAHGAERWANKPSPAVHLRGERELNICRRIIFVLEVKKGLGFWLSGVILPTRLDKAPRTS
jgi:hypothetical protein